MAKEEEGGVRTPSSLPGLRNKRRCCLVDKDISQLLPRSALRARLRYVRTPH